MRTYLHSMSACMTQKFHMTDPQLFTLVEVHVEGNFYLYGDETYF